MSGNRNAINIKEALDDVADYAAQVRRRNKTLIDYYIYPHPTPSEIEAYDPRLNTLEQRIKGLKKLHFNQLRSLLNDPDCLAASYLLQYIEQLQNAIFGFERLFEERYDQSLSQRAPYSNIYERLQIIKGQLHNLDVDRQHDLNRPRAEDIRGTGSQNFCKGAVRLINGSDPGRLTVVDRRDLLEANKTVLKHYGGCFLWWECTSCDFRLRFHLNASQGSSIQNNDEIREHPGIPLEYRSIFLVKSHLYSPEFRTLPRHASKYGCVFCFSEGRPLERGSTTFATGKDLAIHICSHHKSSHPQPLMLSKFNVAINNQLPFF